VLSASRGPWLLLAVAPVLAAASSVWSEIGADADELTSLKPYRTPSTADVEAGEAEPDSWLDAPERLSSKLLLDMDMLCQACLRRDGSSAKHPSLRQARLRAAAHLASRRLGDRITYRPASSLRPIRHSLIYN